LRMILLASCENDGHTVGLCGFGKHDGILEGGFRRHRMHKLKCAHLMIDQNERTVFGSELA
jgi:hypothetical protein